MTDKQPRALRLARELEGVYPVSINDQEAAAAELRRLLAANIDCVAWYEAIKAHREELMRELNHYQAKAYGLTVQRDALVEAANDALELLALIHDENGKAGKKLRSAIAKAESAS